MASKYALVDLENVQPASLKKLKNEGYLLRIFVGANQAKISFELAEEIQRYGENAQYIRLQSSGKNALDFHIAFYMGQFASSDPGCQFLVVSNDTGYDPLLKHLRSVGIQANRSTAVVSTTPTHANNPSPKKPPAQMSLDERVQFARTQLKKAGKAKPAKVTSLAADLHSKFQKKISEQAVQSLISELIKQGIVIDNQGSISYQLGA